MRTVHVRLESAVATSFRCQRAADSLDIDTKKKAVHELTVDVDLETPFNVGLIVGASGSGKTTLARQLFGEACFEEHLQHERPVIDQFPKEWSYDDCVAALVGVGLTSVPCWIRPAHTLSNGQRARAEAALLMAARRDEIVAVDEWTSVVDRTVAKVMSHCIQKHARRSNSRIVLCSCHYDVIEWLNPDWVIDCNSQSFIDRRLLQREYRRSEQLTFDVREVDRSTWRYYSKYHYLSDRLPGGRLHCYGVFKGDDQIGFVCYAQYVPARRGEVPVFHGNRSVVHPDYAGLGIGMRVANVTSEHVARTYGYRVMGKFSSGPFIRAFTRDPNWKIIDAERQVGRVRNRGPALQRSQSFRENVRTVTFEYIGPGSLK